jgi:hypothetical protein
MPYREIIAVYSENRTKPKIRFEQTAEILIVKAGGKYMQLPLCLKRSDRTLDQQSDSNLTSLIPKVAALIVCIKEVPSSRPGLNEVVCFLAYSVPSRKCWPYPLPSTKNLSQDSRSPGRGLNRESRNGNHSAVTFGDKHFMPVYNYVHCAEKWKF